MERTNASHAQTSVGWIKAWPVLILLLIEIVLFFTNYKPGTFLVGWDNLYPELNFAQDFKRNLFAVWQEYRGLGLLDGMSHAANLIHDIQRYALSIVLPISLIRWAYIFLMHLLGGVGMYLLLQITLSSHREKPHVHRLISLVGALFYQYNFATLQQFFLPFEVFLVHFATLPWILYAVRFFVENGRRRDLLLVCIAFLMSIPQAHVPTLFMVSAFALFISLATSVIFSHDRMTALKRVLTIAMIAVAVNAFWGLPFTYATLANSRTISSSKNFEMATNDIYYRNDKYGDFANVSLLKGFSLDFQHYNFKTGTQHLMMQPWISHLNTPNFFIPAWIFVLLMLIGVVGAFRQRNTHLAPFTLIFIAGFSLLGTRVPLIENLNQILREGLPLFHTIFRFTFTKFSILYVLGYTVLLANGLFTIVTLLRQNWQKIALMTIMVAVLTTYAFPAFRGHFFYENLAVNIPQEYFDTFSFFRQQEKNQRVAILPIPWYWAWTQPTWGTIGSGFIWYGISQPITDLAFTPWSDKNESFYWELEYALYSENTSLLAKVFRKYDIDWIYLDKNIQHTEVRRMTYERYEKILGNTSGVKLVKTYRNISIYQITKTHSANNFVSLRTNLSNILPSYNYDNNDVAFTQYGSYVSASEYPADIFYPFRSLFSNKSRAKQRYEAEEDDNVLTFKAHLPEQYTDGSFITPFVSEEFRIVSPDDPNRVISYEPYIFRNSGWLMFSIPKEPTRVYASDNDERYKNQTNDACGKNIQGMAKLEKVSSLPGERPSLRLASRDSRNCIKIDLQNLSHKNGYLIKVVATASPIRGFLISLYNETMKKSDLEIYLPSNGLPSTSYLIVPPRQPDGLGYTLYFNNLSEGREYIENTLHQVEVYQLPYEFMKSIKLQQSASVAGVDDSSNVGNEGVKVDHPNPAYYRVSMGQWVNDSSDLTLILSQSFDPGWTALAKTDSFPFFRRLPDHVLVNNWSNGWFLRSNEGTIIIFFWPQLLQWLGFALLPLPFLVVYWKKV